MRSDWPQRVEVAVSLTFDVDCESGWLGEGEAYATRLSTLSEARFGATRGAPGILPTPNTQGPFYTPGAPAERHPDTCKAIADAGHEVRHHGYLPLRSDAIDEARQREEIERGLEALDTR